MTETGELQTAKLQERIETCIANGRREKTFYRRAARALENPRLLYDYLNSKLSGRLLSRKKSQAMEGIEEQSQAAARKVGPYTSYAQSFQDVFVMEMLAQRSGGHYLEIGAFDAVKISNTYALEHDFGWHGVSLEIDEARAAAFNAIRANKCLTGDATTSDYGAILKNAGFPKQIDYLSVDIEPPWNTLAALNAIPLEQYRFSVITYEHDRHLNGPDYMNLSRELLSSHGYELVVANVRNHGCDYEDWYVDPEVVPEKLRAKYRSADVEYSEIFKA